MATKTLKQKPCKLCQTYFQPYSSLDKYCSSKCLSKALKKNQETPEYKAKLKEKTEQRKAKVRRQKKVEKKRNSLSALIKKADMYFSLYIRQRDRELRGGCCVTCEKYIEEGVSWQCGHFMSRRHLATRWSEKNAHGQCVYCNQHLSGDQYKHGIKIDSYYGQGTAEALFKLANFNEKSTTDELRETIAKYRRLCEGMV